MLFKSVGGLVNDFKNSGSINVALPDEIKNESLYGREWFSKASDGSASVVLWGKRVDNDHENTLKYEIAKGFYIYC